jgi:hypothetical protein
MGSLSVAAMPTIDRSAAEGASTDEPMNENRLPPWSRPCLPQDRRLAMPSVAKRRNELDDEFARRCVFRILDTVGGKLATHQIAKYLANRAKGDGAATITDQRPMEMHVVAGVFEHGQAERQSLARPISRDRSLPLPVEE